MLTSGSSAMVTARILVIAPHSCGAFLLPGNGDDMFCPYFGLFYGQSM